MAVEQQLQSRRIREGSKIHIFHDLPLFEDQDRRHIGNPGMVLRQSRLAVLQVYFGHHELSVGLFREFFHQR